MNTTYLATEVTFEDDIALSCLLETSIFEVQHPEEAFRLTDYAIRNAISYRDYGEAEVDIGFDTWSAGAKDYYDDVLSLYATTIKDWD